MSEHLNVRRIPAVISEPPRMSADLITGSHTLNAAIETRFGFINSLGFDLVLGYRNGLKLPLKNQPSATDETLSIRFELIVAEFLRPEIEKALFSLKETGGQQIKKLLESFQLSVESGHRHGCRIAMTYRITRDTIRNAGGILYLNEVDVLVSAVSIEDTPSHPFSEQADKDHVVLDTMERGLTGKTITLEIVDNGNIVGPRYVNVYNKPYKITPHKDMKKESGLYVTTVNLEDGPDFGKLETDYLSIPEMESSKFVFRDWASAQYGGDISLQKKEELNKLEHKVRKEKMKKEKTDVKIKQTEDLTRALLEINDVRKKKKQEEMELVVSGLKNYLKTVNDSMNETLTKAFQTVEVKTQQSESQLQMQLNAFREAQQINQNLEIERRRAEETIEAERRRSAEMITAERERFAMERERMQDEIRRERNDLQRQELKDKFERRSYERKDTSEVIKFIPSVLMGMGIAAGLIFKFGKSSLRIT